MITVRRADERSHVWRGRHDIWLTFHMADRMSLLRGGFKSLQSLSEEWLPPGAGFRMHAHRDAEIVTYVIEGALAHRDSVGHGGVICRSAPRPAAFRAV